MKELQELSATLEEEITERQATEEALVHKTQEINRMAYFDVLTGLPNRANINERLQEIMENVHLRKSSGAIVFIDLDDLKLVNDTFGHTFGDGLILSAGSRIAEVAGLETFVGRIGIAIYPADGDTSEEILKNADNAMYAVKKSGKNCWRFYQAAMQTENYDKILLVTVCVMPSHAENYYYTTSRN